VNNDETRLLAAVDALIQRQRMKVPRDDGTDTWTTLPSLWEQLERATAYSGTGSGGHGGKARIPISADVVTLVIEIAATLAEAVMEHAGQSKREVPGNLRLLASKIVGDPDADVPWWINQLEKWRSRAREALRLDPQRPRWARGTRCPECSAATITAKHEGETVVRPALSIHWAGPDGEDYSPDDQWRVRAVVCDACSTAWFRGSDLDSLVDQMLRANTARETMAG
jgi:hypothetical protein